MWNPFGNLLNLYRIKKLYELIREIVDNPKLLGDSRHWLEIFKTVISIREVKEMLSGYKTYIVAILTAVVTLLHSLGYIDETLFQTLLALLGAGAISTVAAKINNVQKSINK